jgi:hypothetical protein
MLRRLLIAALVLGVGILPTIAQDKDKDKDKKEDKKNEKKEEPKGGEKALLKWKFDSKTPFYQKMVTETKQTMKVQNQDVNQTQKQTFYFSWTPVRKDGESWVIKQKIEGVAMDIDIGQQKISYDSTKGKDAGNNPLGEFFNALKDSEFTITLNTKDMKVTKVEGREEFLKKLVAANPQMKPLLEQILSEKALVEMAEPTFAAIAGKEVTKGESWERKSTLDMGPIGKYENDYKYTFEGTEGKLDKIKVDTTLKYKEPGEVAGGGTSGLPFKIKNADLKSSSATGVILFDPEKGWISKSDMKLELGGKLGIEIGGQTTEVNLTQTQSSTVETSDKSLLPATKAGG